MEDFDGDNIPEFGFQLLRNLDDMGARQLPGDPREWLGLYKIESTGFRSILPEAAKR